MQGDYKGLGVHPGVFTTPAELGELAARINRNGSYSRGRFAALAAHVARDLTSGIDWDAAYSGPDGGVYEYAFSYEPQDGREAEIHDALKLPFGVKAPAGAAVVASLSRSMRRSPMRARRCRRAHPEAPLPRP